MNEKTKHRFSIDWTRSRQARFQAQHSEEKDPNDPLGEGKSLGKQGVLLLVINALFAVAGALSTTFVNIYLWKVENDYLTIGLYNLSAFVASGFTFLIMGRFVKQANKMISLRLGVAISAAFYLAVLLSGEKAVDFAVWLGLLQGIGTGLYWLAFNVIYFEITNPMNRDSFNGLNGFWGSIAWMISPWVAGFIISSMDNTYGYRIIFTISGIIFSIGVVISFFLKHRKVQGHYEFLPILKSIRKENKIWKSISLAMVAQGAREGVFAFLISLLVFMTTQNEMKLGNYNLITAAVALLSYYLVGKYLHYEWRKKSMLLATIMLSVVMLPLFWKVNYMTLIWFGIGTNLFLPLYLVPLTSIVFDAIGKDRDSAEHRVEFVVIRELGLNIGRVLSVLAFIAVIMINDSEKAIISLMFVIGSIPVLAWVALRKERLQSYLTENKKEDTKQENELG